MTTEKTHKVWEAEQRALELALIGMSDRAISNQTGLSIRDVRKLLDATTKALRERARKRSKKIDLLAETIRALKLPRPPKTYRPNPNIIT